MANLYVVVVVKTAFLTPQAPIGTAKEDNLKCEFFFILFSKKLQAKNFMWIKHYLPWK